MCQQLRFPNCLQCFGPKHICDNAMHASLDQMKSNFGCKNMLLTILYMFYTCVWRNLVFVFLGTSQFNPNQIVSYATNPISWWILGGQPSCRTWKRWRSCCTTKWTVRGSVLLASQRTMITSFVLSCIGTSHWSPWDGSKWLISLQPLLSCIQLYMWSM